MNLWVAGVSIGGRDSRCDEQLSYLVRMIQGARYVHTNLIARDWRRLASFYTTVFGCVFVPPERRFAGAEIEAGTGVTGASLEGAHLRMPGNGDAGPTIEIFTSLTSRLRSRTGSEQTGIWPHRVRGRFSAGRSKRGASRRGQSRRRDRHARDRTRTACHLVLRDRPRRERGRTTSPPWLTSGGKS